VGLVGSPGKGKHANFDRVRRGITDICGALKARMVTPLTHLPSLEERLHQAQVTSHFISVHKMRRIHCLQHLSFDQQPTLAPHQFRSAPGLMSAQQSKHQKQGVMAPVAWCKVLQSCELHLQLYLPIIRHESTAGSSLDACAEALHCPQSD
jgi:hypothetical protein